MGISFHIEAPYPVQIPSSSYIEWTANNGIFASGNGIMSAWFVPRYDDPSEYFDIRCRMRDFSSNTWSAWSNAITLMYYPPPYMAPAADSLELDVTENPLNRLPATTPEVF